MDEDAPEAMSISNGQKIETVEKTVSFHPRA